MLPEWLNVETVGVVLAVAYLLLAMSENAWCWLCAFISSAIYVWVFMEADLLMQSALNLFYMGMAIYGWYEWRLGGEQHSGVSISRWSWRQHAVAIIAVLIVTQLSAQLLNINGDASLVWLDSLVTWGAVLTTWMATRKILENWIYWMVIDLASMYLYLDRELYQTTVLFGVYVLMAVAGYITWRKHYRALSATTLPDTTADPV